MRSSERMQNGFVRAGIILLLLGLASATGYVFNGFGLPKSNIAIVYVLAVLLSTLFVPGYAFGFAASILSAFAFNFLFIEPYFTFTTNAPSYLVTFVIMTITAFVTSTLTSHVKLSERQAQEREAEIRALYDLTNRLTDAAGLEDIAETAAEMMSTVLLPKAGCLCFDEKGFPEKTFIQQGAAGKLIRRKVDDPDKLSHRMEGLRAGVAKGDEFCDWPIYGKESVLGLIRLPVQGAESLTKTQRRLLHSMIESIALAMDRIRSSQQRIKLGEETERERYRSNLLRSISHDLRTPLAGMLGTAEMLLSMTPGEDPRYPLIQGVQKDVGWLHSLVENILSLTRLKDGNLGIGKQEEAVEEVVGGATSYISRRYPQWDIEVVAPEALFLVPMDAKLMSQVLINLLDNAVKHTEPSGKISVIVTRDSQQNQAVFSVRDTGSGIAKADLPHIFEMFYTSQFHQSDSQLGSGLGLAICEAIVKAHGGAITAKNREDTSGAEFTFTLPLGGKADEPLSGTNSDR